MIYRYNRYLIRNLAWATLLITLSLTSIVWLTQALRFIDYIVNRGVGMGDFIYLTALMLPSLLLIIIPVALFCAVLFTYHKLTTDSELVVLYAAGLSRWQLAKPACIVALCCAGLGYFISFYLLPVSYHQFREMQVFMRDNYASLLLQEEVFNTPVNGLTVFIRTREENGMLHGILVHDNRNPSIATTMMAEKARLVQTSHGPSFMMENGSRQEFRDGRLSFLDFDSYMLDMSFYANKVQTREKDPRELFISELFADTNPERRAHGHQRLSWPFLSVTLALIAAGFMLSGQFSRRGQPKRIVFSVIVLLVVTIGLFSLTSLLEKHPEASFLMYLLVFGAAFVSLYLLMREVVMSRIPPFAVLKE